MRDRRAPSPRWGPRRPAAAAGSATGGGDSRKPVRRPTEAVTGTTTDPVGLVRVRLPAYGWSVGEKVTVTTGPLDDGAERRVGLDADLSCERCAVSRSSRSTATSAPAAISPKSSAVGLTRGAERLDDGGGVVGDGLRVGAGDALERLEGAERDAQVGMTEPVAQLDDGPPAIGGVGLAQRGDDRLGDRQRPHLLVRGSSRGRPRRTSRRHGRASGVGSAPEPGRRRSRRARSVTRGRPRRGRPRRCAGPGRRPR